MDGPTLTVRKFTHRYSLEDLVTVGTLSRDLAAQLRRAVDDRKNILISGGTGTGKTTLLNALAATIPDADRIVLIEETSEILIEKPNLVRFEARRAQIPLGQETPLAAVTISDLVRATLRTPWGEVAAFSAHVSRDDCQLARVAEIARAHAALRPTVLMGDFNTVDASPAIRALDGFVDVFRAVNPDRRGSTGRQQPWAAARTAQRRIDYIFVAGVADPDIACESRVVLDQPRRQPDGRTLWPSDHYGVLADLDIFGIKCAP